MAFFDKNVSCEKNKTWSLFAVTTDRAFASRAFKKP